jgi:hypothetical protein
MCIALQYYTHIAFQCCYIALQYWKHIRSQYWIMTVI